MADLATLAIEIKTSGGSRATSDLRNVERASKQTEKAVDSLSITINALKRLMALGIGVQGISSLIQMADKMKSLNAQVKFVTSSIAELNAVQAELFQISQRTRSSLEATTQLYVRSARALKDYGASQQQILQFTETINKAMAVGGVGAQEQASALMQLSQALGSGRLQGDEFRTIAETAPIILDVVAEYMGKSRAEVKKLATEGKITSQLLFEAINSSTQKINKQFEGMPLTFSQAMQQMGNAALKFVGDLDSAHGVSGLLAQGVSFLAQNFEILAKAIGYATIAYISYNAASFASNFKQASGGVGILSASFGYLTTMIRGATTALLANPFGALAIAITGAAFVFDAFLSDLVVGGSKFQATWGDVAIGVWQDFKDIVGQTATWFSTQWDNATEIAGNSFYGLLGSISSVGLGITQTLKTLVNSTIGLFYGGVETLRTIWSNFPTFMTGFAKTAVNSLVSIVEKGMQALIDLIKAPLELLNQAYSQFSDTPLIDTSSWKIDLSSFQSSLTEAEKAIDIHIGDAMRSALSTDYIDNSLKTVMDYLKSVGDRVAQAKGESGTADTSLTSTLPATISGGSNGKASKALNEWKQHYNELQRASADGLTRIALEQERAMREMLEKAKKANVGFEEIERAKNLIYERYAKERQEIAEQYVPELKHMRELKEQLLEIQQLKQLGKLTGPQADKASNAARWNAGEAIAKQAGYDAVDGFDRWKEQFDPMQAIKNEQTAKTAELKSLYDQNLIQYEDFINAKAQIDAKATADTQNLFMDSIAGFGSAIDTMLGVMKNAGMEQSGIYKTMFAVSKAFAIADSIIKIQQGIANAASLPFPQNLGAMATVASNTASIISTIQGTNLKGMAHDGIDNIPREGTWLLDKGERVVDSRTNADLKKFLSSQNNQNRSNGKSVVNVKIINNGQPVNAQVESNETADGVELTVTLLSKMEDVANKVYTKRQAQDMRAGGILRRQNL